MKLFKVIVLVLLFLLLPLLSACERNNTVCPPELDADKPTIRLSDLLLITSTHLISKRNKTDHRIKI